MSKTENDAEQPRRLDPELYEPLTAEDIRRIQEEPFGHDEELDAEGATTYDFPPGRYDADDWHDTSGRSIFEVLNLSERQDVGSLVMKPGVHTNYLEFTLHAPPGPAKECTCNECWSRFWIAPFGQAVECPYCHARGINIREKRVIGGE